MADQNKAAVDVAALQAEIERLTADSKKKDEIVAKAIEDRKAAIVSRHVLRGVAPAQANKLAQNLDADVLDEVLTAMHPVIRPVATGVTATEAPATPSADPVVELARAAAEIHKQHPAWTKERAYAEATRLRPDLYLNQRGSIAGNSLSGRA